MAPDPNPEATDVLQLVVGLMLCTRAEALDACNDVAEVVGREVPRVGRVVVQGNTVTAERVIRHQLNINPGGRLRFAQLERGRTNLIRTGFFEVDQPPAVVAVPPEGGGPGWEVFVRVKEVRTGNVILHVGANSNAGVRGALNRSGP
jgi:outer membrane protein assembly factor BamA